MVLFKDFYKPVKSFFSDNYQEENVSLKAKTKPSKNLELKFETKRERGKEYVAKLGWNANFKVQDAQVKAEGEVLQAGEVNEKVTVKGLYDGLTLEFGGKLLTQKDDSSTRKANPEEEDKISRDTFNAGFTYNHKYLDTNLTLTKKSLNPYLLSGSLAAKYEEFSLGGDFEYELEKKENGPLFKKYNFGATYKSETFLLAALVEKLKTAKFGLLHNVDKTTDLSVELAYKLDKQGPFNVTVGVSKKLDDVSNVKAKLNNDGILATAYQVKLKNDVTATASLEVSAKEISTVGKLGFELSFEPLD